MSAKRCTVLDSLSNDLPGISIIGGILFEVEGGMRDDRSPVEASQITGVGLCDESVGDKNILPPIIVDVAEQ